MEKERESAKWWIDQRNKKAKRERGREELEKGEKREEVMRKITELRAFVFLLLSPPSSQKPFVGPPSKTASLTGVGYVNAITTNTVSICLA